MRLMNEETQKIAKWLGAGSINVFGLPFAGKDTQGRKIADMFGGELVAGGDILRHYHDQTKLKELLSTGDLIPTDIYLEILLPYLSRADFENKPLILSSVGRMEGEEPVIMKATTDSSHPMRAVILLQLSEDDVWQRFEEAKILDDRGERNDDDKVVLETRLKEFREKTEPVLDYYRNEGLLIEIDGTLPREEVTEEILKALAERASK